jgi:predicted enzyme related to lactoylglutathione lyase
MERLSIDKMRLSLQSMSRWGAPWLAAACLHTRLFSVVLGGRTSVYCSGCQVRQNAGDGPPAHSGGLSRDVERFFRMSVQVEQKSYEMPPRDGFTVTHFLTVADIERSVRFYEKVFGGRILSRGDSKGAPGYIQIANTWLLVNVGGGPTPDKPTVTLSVLADPDKISSFMNIRVTDIRACYELWKSRGAEFITEPIPKYGETRCYIRDPDGYIIEVGQSTELTYG